MHRYRVDLALRLGAARRARRRVSTSALTSAQQSAPPPPPSPPQPPRAPLWPWLANFRRELAEEFAPLPDPPGFVDTSLVDTRKWEQLPPGAVRHAMRLTARELRSDWVRMFRTLLRRHDAVVNAGAGGAGGNASASAAQQPPDSSLSTQAHGAAAAVAAAAATMRAPTPDELRAAAEIARARAARLATSPEAEQLKEQVASIAADGLRLARDCVDEFLLGYEEGKDKEARRHKNESAAAAPAAAAAEAPSPYVSSTAMPSTHQRARP